MEQTARLERLVQVRPVSSVPVEREVPASPVAVVVAAAAVAAKSTMRSLEGVNASPVLAVPETAAVVVVVAARVALAVRAVVPVARPLASSFAAQR